ncbi:MAG: hypothetical protein WEE89_08800 [Gemmatimonadota bacterium]
MGKDKHRIPHDVFSLGATRAALADGLGNFDGPGYEGHRRCCHDIETFAWLDPV